MKPRAPDALAICVTDHALLRYLERRYGLQVERMREQIAEHTCRALDHGAKSVIWDNVRFVVVNGAVVTTLDKDMPLREWGET